MIEQILVEPSIHLPLSQDDLFDVPCDKDDNEDIPSIHSSSPNKSASDIVGPITRNKAKQLEKEMHS
jgi:hypothetical protein